VPVTFTSTTPQELVIPREGVERDQLLTLPQIEVARHVIPREGVESYATSRLKCNINFCSERDPERGS